MNDNKVIVHKDMIADMQKNIDTLRYEVDQAAAILKAAKRNRLVNATLLMDVTIWLKRYNDGVKR